MVGCALRTIEPRTIEPPTIHQIQPNSRDGFTPRFTVLH